MNIDIKRDDLIMIAEALEVYKFNIEEDKDDYYGYPYSTEQVQKVIDYIDNVLDGESK